MTAITNTQAVGSGSTKANYMREDLANIIWTITPTQTPFASGIAKEAATNTYHEWLTRDLAATTVNAQAEGDDVVSTSDAASVTARLGNYTQILRKVVTVSGTAQKTNNAGMTNAMADQIAVKGLEIRRDLEATLMCNAAGSASNMTAVGASGGARSMRGVEGWIATNATYGTSGAAPVYTANPGTAPTDGTQAAFTESMLRTVLAACFTQGGEPDTIMMGPAQRQVFSTFTGVSAGGTVASPAAGFATRFDDASDSKVYATVSVYVSDYGSLKAIPNRFQRNRTALVLEMGKWALATLRPMQTVDLAKTGDADRKLIVTECTLVARQEKASGACRDLS